MFLLIVFLVIALITWQAIHPERAQAGHVLVTIILCGLGLSLFPFSKGLPRLKPAKRLNWLVDYWGVSDRKFVPLKFYEYQEANDYFQEISNEFSGPGEVTRLSPITKDRQNNPIVVIALTPMKLQEQVKYLRRKKDGRERIFRPNEQNCTSLLYSQGRKNR